MPRLTGPARRLVLGPFTSAGPGALIILVLLSNRRTESYIVRGWSPADCSRDGAGGGKTVVDALQTFSPGHLTGVLVTILISWLVWPIVCGLLGARRGQGLRGAVHGLFWGPIGLPIVLLSKAKHRCPTCGHQTLTTAAGRPPPHAVVMPSMCPPQDVLPPMAGVVSPPIAVPRSNGPLPEPHGQRIPQRKRTGVSGGEQARLLAWVNGG